jgi:hypothetical protein
MAPSGSDAGPQPAAAGGPQREAARQTLHDLQNTLASLKLRVGVLAADPTCRWAQEDNIAAIDRIVADAMKQCHRLRQDLGTAGPAPRSAPRRRRRS